MKNQQRESDTYLKFFASGGAAFLLLAGCLTFANIATAQDDKKLSSISEEDAKKLKSPTPYTRKSILQGKNTFVRYCVGCHGADGKSQVDVVSDATDLTTPKFWKHGASEGQVFRSIRNGAGETMPAFASQISNDQDIWHIVNFIRSLWPESERPPLQEDDGKSKDGKNK